MDILVGCEESQTLCKAFRKLGHKAFSCDLEDTRGNDAWHIKGDIMEIMKIKWDAIFLFPDCAAMALSGNRWYGEGMPYNNERIDAILWTQALWSMAKRYSDYTMLENPASVIFRHIEADVQYIHPWQFGHAENKRTGLALNNLPRLRPTKIVDEREDRVWRMAPGENRKRDRSKTYDGIAEAMAVQWSYYMQTGKEKIDDFL